MMSRVQNGINGWYKDGAKNAEVLGFHRAMGTKRGSGYNNDSNQRQTDNKSSLLELEVVQNEWYDGEHETRDRGSLRESEGV